MEPSHNYNVRILIADDQKDFAAFVERLLTALNHDVVEVVTSGGLAVIQAYERHKPDIVLMDFHMPQFNGMTACRHIRSKHATAKIIVMSGDVELERASAQAGAVAAIRKPFSGSELRKLLESFDPSKTANSAERMPLPDLTKTSPLQAKRNDPPIEGEVAHV